MVGKAMEVCLWVVIRFNSYSVRNSVLIISHITLRDCRVHFFPTTFLEVHQIRFFRNSR